MGLLYQLHMERTLSLYGTVLRFHVRAASNEEKEQQKKLLVRDGLLKKMKEDVEGASGREELEKTLEKKTRELERAAEQILEEEGRTKPVKVYFTTERFPVRAYGNVVFPAGEYRALRVDIGEAKGCNWWCAIYPELCYNAGETMFLSKKGKKDVKKVIPEEERKILTGEKGHFRFRLWKWISGWLENASAGTGRKII